MRCVCGGEGRGEYKTVTFGRRDILYVNALLGDGRLSDVSTAVNEEYGPL